MRLFNHAFVFHNRFNNFNNTKAQRSDSIYHMALNNFEIALLG